MEHVKTKLVMKTAQRNAERLNARVDAFTTITDGKQPVVLHNDGRVKADRYAAMQRLKSVADQDIDPVIRNYRIVSAMPNLALVENMVRYNAYRFGLDESELWADTIDNICEDTSWPIPLNPEHFKAYVIRRARRIATTGHHRKNRIKSKLTMSISGLERQENSPAYNPYIGEKGQSLPAFSADRIHYIGHKAPGNPEMDSFRKSGRIDQYLRDKGLDTLSEHLHNSVTWYRKKGDDRPAHWGINWTDLARKMGISNCQEHDTDKGKPCRSMVNKLRESVTELLRDIPDKYSRDNWTYKVISLGWTVRAFSSQAGHPIFTEDRKVSTAEWKVSHVKRNALLDHYRENQPHANCTLCREIETDIVRWATTSVALDKAYHNK